MAYDDTLFQLGMDLARGSSTAQKEDHGSSADVARDKGKYDEIERDGVRSAGTGLNIDLFGARKLDDVRHIERTLKRCVEVAGATVLRIHLHEVSPDGAISGVAVLAEAHLSIRTWPKAEYAALDLFMGPGGAPLKVLDVLKQAFRPTELTVREHQRGPRTETVRRVVAEPAPKMKVMVRARTAMPERLRATG